MTACVPVIIHMLFQMFLQISVLGKEHTVYSHSYLGLGLMAARAAIFNHNQKSGDTKLESPCMVTSGATKWSFHGKDYTINPITAKVSGRVGDGVKTKASFYLKY